MGNRCWGTRALLQGNEVVRRLAGSFPRRMSRWLSWTLNEALPKLFHCSVRNTWPTEWLGMAQRISGLNKILVPRVSFKIIGRFLMILSVKFPLNLCSRLRFFAPKHTTSTLCTYESSHLDFNCRGAHGGCIGYYSTTCIKLAMFCYIITVKNVLYVLCINLYKLPQLYSSIWNTLYEDCISPSNCLPTNFLLHHNSTDTTELYQRKFSQITFIMNNLLRSWGMGARIA
jgi:hypothetical protein